MSTRIHTEMLFEPAALAPLKELLSAYNDRQEFFLRAAQKYLDLKVASFSTAEDELRRKHHLEVLAWLLGEHPPDWPQSKNDPG